MDYLLTLIMNMLNTVLDDKNCIIEMYYLVLPYLWAVTSFMDYLLTLIMNMLNTVLDDKNCIIEMFCLAHIQLFGIQKARQFLGKCIKTIFISYY